MAGGERRIARLGWAVVGLAALALLTGGCGTKSKKPRTREEIFRDRLQIDTLFMTEDGRRAVRPMNPDRVVVVDGQLAWPAWQCDNPDCPGRVADGGPLLFPWPDPFKSVAPDGTIVVRQPLTKEDEALFEKYAEQNCPACLKARNVSAESKARRQQYKNWCQPHVLPAAAKRLQELEREAEALLGREPGPPG